MTDYLELVKRLRRDNVIFFGPDDFINGRTEVRKPTAKELEAADAIEAQAKRIVELEAALKPFADEAQFFVSKALDNHLAAPDRLYLTIGQFRAARKVLGESK
jgi:hypothetical protein